MNETYPCSHCGAKHPTSELFRCGNDDLCPDCAAQLTILCDECQTRIYRDDDRGDSQHVLCQACCEAYYTTCDNCGAMIRTNHAYYPEDSDETFCWECYERRTRHAAIHEYDYKPDLSFHGKGLRHFGVELEIDEGGQSAANARRLLDIGNRSAENLYIKTDGSLDDGLELVTHPMTLDYHRNEMPWADVLAAARSMGYLSHRAETCGLHVHVSRLAFGCTYDQQETAIARLVYFVEKFWPEMLRFSRRTESQLNRWAARYGARLCPKDQLDHAKHSGAGRYAAVNLTNGDTIEIRIFRGTLKLNTLLATLHLVNHLCEVAVSLSDAALQDMSWHGFLRRITEPGLIQYLKERNLYVNEPVAVEEDE
ncbi:zinc-binding protein [Agathobaculum sp.]|uniref:zinc-binding protein n=1 Tax=Agathobaculum sp. TaxID=2048138 RepID=UPI002A7F67D0|nr:zinc-binding protein [Agathobaculum sp.]MDY3617787.1 zinc-binding protein [Agathobaculum sp.]